jgi:hypothetical protein
MAGALKERLSKAMREGLGRAGKGTSASQAAAAASSLEELGITGVHFKSSDEDLQEFTDRLWHDQDDRIEPRSREWRQIMHYVANEQFLAYHRGRREWIERKAVPWRIRASYNIMGKAAELRTSRLTENKPAISVQPASVDRADVDRAEYKETLFWGLWEKLSLLSTIVEVRAWATLNGCGFLKAGWDPEAGVELPRTLKRPKFATIQVPKLDALGQQVPDPVTGAPVMIEKQIYAGIEEVYLDAKGEELGPTEMMVDDEDNPGKKKKVRVPVPDEADCYNEGEAYVDARSAFNIRYDVYADEPDESWYVQDTEIHSGLNVVSMFPDAIEKLREARTADDEEKASFWKPMTERESTVTLLAERSRKNADDQLTGELDKEYVVRETWIYPKTRLLRKLWGKQGAYLVTVGDKLVHKSALPEWARRRCNFIRLPDVPEKGNHYCKPHLRDILPLQDDINRARSQMAERNAIESRLILGAAQGHQMNVRLLGGMPGVLLTYRSAAHKPEPINLQQRGQGADSFYQTSLEAATDLGNMNDATTGKLPSAGLAAKAIYALQYADERSIKKTSALQDVALKKLALALDAITRVEYKEARKVRVTGEDRSFLVESEILPEHLDTEVDYFFTPGSMMSRQKEAIRNEMIALMKEGLVDPNVVKKHIATASPDVFRTSYDLQEAKARRVLSKILRHGERGLMPDRVDDPAIHLDVIKELMLTSKWDVLGDEEKQSIEQLFAAHEATIAQQQLAAQQAANPALAAAPPAPTGSGEQPPLGAPPAAPGVAEGASELEAAAGGMAPPAGFGQ